MRALAVTPLKSRTTRLLDCPEPSLAEGSLLLQMVAVGICGTDREIVAGHYGWAPPGCDYLILGHESLARVLEAPPSSGYGPGDWVCGIVRRPDPIPCANCAIGEWDMCRNGLYTEHGIKELHGYARDRYRLEPAFAVKVDPELGELGVLIEPASVVAKAWEHAERIAHRARFEPRRVLITGAGPIGLLAALLGRQRNLEVHVVDQTSDGPKPKLVRELGAQYHVGIATVRPLANSFDLVFECTGASALVVDAIELGGPGSVVCLAGVSSGGRTIAVDLGQLNRNMVLENEAVFGSVNANRRHYEQAAAALGRADRAWLSGLITRRVPLANWADAMERLPGDVKTVLVP